ncbi:hypothetical protein SISNIDRAFT_159008 [Sistotremastrum niveocremeum HHB9708]|uniref:Uncharacterized protein n=1 Tax=Sistotremastrum niveocremeum HHB9708 TaxID=1314777 RepID=A0A164STL2_9AGAM|nr:hypothetical protein SISNIDRAFT_159008 [Sistotremastrum niveocremeum HHB9708]
MVILEGTTVTVILILKAPNSFAWYFWSVKWARQRQDLKAARIQKTISATSSIG